MPPRATSRENNVRIPRSVLFFLAPLRDSTPLIKLPLRFLGQHARHLSSYFVHDTLRHSKFVPVFPCTLSLLADRVISAEKIRSEGPRAGNSVSFFVREKRKSVGHSITRTFRRDA